MDISSLNGVYNTGAGRGSMIDSIINRESSLTQKLPDFEALLRNAAASRGVPDNSNDAVADKGAAESGEAKERTFRAVTIDKTDKLYEQCLELEIFMVKTLISSMRNTIQKSGLIEEGFAGKMYEDMLYDEYTREFTKNANFGMADLAYLELTGQRGKQIIRNN